MARTDAIATDGFEAALLTALQTSAKNEKAVVFLIAPKVGGVKDSNAVMPRQALHAQTIGFLHPTLKKRLYFEAVLPPDFAAVLDKWRKYIKADVSFES